ncbi:MAG: glycosyl transferase [Pseudomonadota bacterium]
MTGTNVVCIKWGTKYPSIYVNRLFRGVQRTLERDFRFVCFTDDADGILPGVETHPLPVEPFEDALQAGMTRTGRKGAWRKVSLFRPGLVGLSGPRLILDLDVIITGGLDAIFDAAPDHVAMRREWRYEVKGQDGGHGSVCCFDPDIHPFLYEDFAADPMGMIDTYKNSEQFYTSMRSAHYGKLAYLPGDLVCSFKRNAIPTFPLNLFRAPRLPDNCRVMCFHGVPTVEDAVAATTPSLRRRTLPAAWLTENWRD